MIDLYEKLKGFKGDLTTIGTKLLGSKRLPQGEKYPFHHYELLGFLHIHPVRKSNDLCIHGDEIIYQSRIDLRWTDLLPRAYKVFFTIESVSVLVFGISNVASAHPTAGRESSSSRFWVLETLTRYEIIV